MGDSPSIDDESVKKMIENKQKERTGRQIIITDKEEQEQRNSEILQKDAQEMLENDLSCAICQDIYINPLILNCSHSFCKFCVYRWLTKNKGCPQCRMAVAFQAENLALRNVINKMVQKSSEQFQTNRKNNVDQRLKDEEKQEKDSKPKFLKNLPSNNRSTNNNNTNGTNNNNRLRSALQIFFSNGSTEDDEDDDEDWETEHDSSDNVHSERIEESDEEEDDDDDEGPNRDDTFELEEESEDISSEDITSEEIEEDDSENESDVEFDDDNESDDESDDEEDNNQQNEMDNEMYDRVDDIIFGRRYLDSSDSDESSIYREETSDYSPDYILRHRARIIDDDSNDSSNDSMDTEEYSNDTTIEYGTSEDFN